MNLFPEKISVIAEPEADQAPGRARPEDRADDHQHRRGQLGVRHLRLPGELGLVERRARDQMLTSDWL